jgi:TetR/AcrR family transcriptional regulator, mexJK operon transcriptional repressor
MGLKTVRYGQIFLDIPQRNIQRPFFLMTPPTTHPADPQSETPRQVARRETILQVARESFLEEGYAATSMSSIAAKLGGSKGTLYNYYGSKEDLFAAVMTAHCAVARARFEVIDVKTSELADRLRRFGEAYLDVILDEEFLAVHRLVTGESGRFPEIGATFYEAAGKRGKSWLAVVFAEEMEKGVIRRDDPDKVARQFLGLCRSDVHTRRAWNVMPKPQVDEIAKLAAEATEVIMAAYRPV